MAERIGKWFGVVAACIAVTIWTVMAAGTYIHVIVW